MRKVDFIKIKEQIGKTYELAASLNPFSIAGMKFDGIACPTIIFSNSNLVADPSGRGST